MQKNIDVFEAGFRFHVYNRAVGNEKLFFKERNYTYFLKILNDKTSAYINIIAYCLLGNHYHLLIMVKDTAKPKDVSEAFRSFGISYSQAINKQEGRKGTLFMKPIKRKRINSEEYFRTVLIYIHTNPFLHGIVNNYQTYKWSSYGFFIDKFDDIGRETSSTNKRDATSDKDESAIALSDGITSNLFPPSDGIPEIPLFNTKEIIQNYFNDMQNFIVVHQQKRGFDDISDLAIEN